MKTDDRRDYLHLVNGTRFVKLQLHREIEREARWQGVRRKATAVLFGLACLGMTWVVCETFLALCVR